MQFSIYFYMSVKCKAMIDYESMSKLLHSFDVKNFPKTH
jgi:hypothetical protein